MNVLSLFGGIETGLIALKELGIYPENYYSSEIDKFACSVSRYLHPEVIELGSVEGWKNWELPKVDLILAGPPCQGFSIAGKGLDWNDPRSKLFFTAIEILSELKKRNPELNFLFENVYSMKKFVRAGIDKLMGTDSFMVNSALVSAQNRKRLYWTKFPGPPPQFIDKDLYLKDILENEVDEKYYLNNTISGTRALKNFIDGLRCDYEKSLSITAAGSRKLTNAGSTVLMVQTPRRNNRGGIRAIDGKSPTLTDANFHQNNFIFCAIKNRGEWKVKLQKSQCIDANYSKGVDNHGQRTMVVNAEMPPLFLKVSKKLSLKDDQKKASTLTGGAKSAGDHSSMDYILYQDIRFRRFTPVECERLQTLPDNTTEFGINDKGKTVKISNSQRYKMIGNGWTMEVIKGFLRGLL